MHFTSQVTCPQHGNINIASAASQIVLALLAITKTSEPRSALWQLMFAPQHGLFFFNKQSGDVQWMAPRTYRLPLEVAMRGASPTRLIVPSYA